MEIANALKMNIKTGGICKKFGDYLVKEDLQIIHLK